MPKIRPPAAFEVVGHGNVVNYGCDGFRFLEPVLAGDRIRSRTRLLDVQEHRQGTRVTLEIAVHVVGKERPSLVYKAVTRYAAPRG